MVAGSEGVAASRGDAEARQGEERFMGWWMAGAFALVAILLLGAVYGYLGWNRMDAICSTDAAVPPGATGASVKYSWSWSPPGFSCTWGETAVTKLWW